MKQHAIEQYPKESCGLLLKDGTYVPLDNEHPEPEKAFKIDGAKIFGRGDDIQAIIHSHPDGNRYPSYMDMVSQSQLNIPFGIVWTNGKIAEEPFFWGNGIERPSLKERPFRHGVTDCYSIIKDWYESKDILIPDFPRKWDWWKKSENLYEENFIKAGFKRAEGDPKIGDVIFFAISSKVINHAAIYIGGSQLIHHLNYDRKGYSPASLSRQDSYYRWDQYATYKVRHDKSSLIR
jgi:cell wall-associated NlpC family hydrolase